METSKKLISLFMVVTVVPYLSFWYFTGFDKHALPYFIFPLIATMLFAYSVTKDDLLSIRKLTDFAKALRQDNWSYRIKDVKSEWLLEVAEVFNIAVERFEKKQNELRQVIDLVPGFIYAKDKDETILLCNSAFAHFLDSTPSTIVGKKSFEYDGFPFVNSQTLEKTISSRQISEENVIKDGIIYTYLVFKTPFFSIENKVIASLFFAYDISSLKEVQNNLKTLNVSLGERIKKEVAKNLQKDQELIKAKERFIRNAVHEINTALTVIMLNAEYIIKEYGSNKPTSAILGAAKNLSSAYGDLSYSTIKDSPTFQKESLTDISEIVKDRVEFFRDIGSLSDIVLEDSIVSDINMVINRAKFTRLVDNNLSNAIKYSYPQKTVYIRLFVADSKSVLEFESFGKTIEDKDKIFELYMREDGVKGGHGIGLSMVKEICLEYNISIEVQTDLNSNIFRYRFNNPNRV